MTKRNILFCILVFIGLITVAILFRSEDDAGSSRSKIKWNEGDTLHFVYSAKNKISISDPILAEKKSATEQSFDGRLFIKLYEVRDDSIRALAEFRPFDNYFEEQKLSDSFSPAFELIFSYDGEISQIIFAPNTTIKTQKKIQGLFDTVNFKLKNNAKSWSSNEINSIGKYTASYAQNKNGEIDKKILEFAELKDTSGYIERVEVVKSDTKFKLSKEKSWIDELNSTEELKLFRENKAQIISVTDVKLRSYIPDSSDKPDWADFSYDQAVKQISSTYVFNPQLHLIDSHVGDRKIALSANLDKLKGPLKSDEVLKTTSLIAEDIKKYPQLIDHLLNTLKDEDYSGDPGAHTIYALQKAGTDQAQEALTSIISSDAYHDFNRRRAIIALGGISVNSKTEDFLWDLYNSYDHIERTLYSENAAYALGSIAAHLNEAQPERSDNIVVKLAESLSNSLETNKYDKARMLILSIGNSSRADVAEILYPLLEANSDKLREAAAEALSITDDQDGVILLSEKLLEEDSPTVRRKIIYTLNKREVNEASLSAVQQAIIEEDNEQIREEMAHFLLKASLQTKLNKDMIKQALALETNRKIYNSLSQILVN